MPAIFLSNISLSRYTNYKIGGKSKYFAEAKKEQDVFEIIDVYTTFAPLKIRKNIFIIAHGTNVLFPDEGYNGLVIKISIDFIELNQDGVILAGAGTSMEDIVSFAVQEGLSGLEWAGGLPGSFGGAIRGNAGAFGGEMKDSIIMVRSMDLVQKGKILERNNKECDFGYRASIFKGLAAKEVILSGAIKLMPGNKKEIIEKTEAHKNYRKEKQPIELPSAGSTFKNINIEDITPEQKKEWSSAIKTDPFPVVPAAFLISEAGLKGKKIGGAMISEKHPNFFVNIDGATSFDVKSLIEKAKKTIKEKFGIEMEEEVQIVE